MFLIIVLILLFAMIALFLYLLLRRVKYDGYILVNTDDSGKRTFGLEIDRDPDTIETGSTIIFKVVETPLKDMPVE